MVIRDSIFRFIGIGSYSRICPEQDWLLVFDNAENARDLEDYWPPATKGAILLTSQNQHWLHQENVAHGIRVESFSTGEGVSVLRSIMQKHGRRISESAAVNG